MALVPHPCNRLDCAYNNHPSGRCGYFHGDLYYFDCIHNATNYITRDELRKKREIKKDQ